MGQINFNNQKPKYCNLQAIQSGGSEANYPIPNDEVWMVDTTNSSKNDGTGKYDSYVVGDGTTVASELVVYNIEDKEYEPTKFSGLGKKVLPKNIVSNKNVLTQAMVNTANTIYHIQYDYDLNGQTITLPAGCVLEFDGGSVKNGILSSNDLKIQNESDKKIFDNIHFQGACTNAPVKVAWFVSSYPSNTNDVSVDNTNEINMALSCGCKLVIFPNDKFLHITNTLIIESNIDLDIDKKRNEVLSAYRNVGNDIPCIFTDSVITMLEYNFKDDSTNKQNIFIGALNFANYKTFSDLTDKDVPIVKITSKYSNIWGIQLYCNIKAADVSIDGKYMHNYTGISVIADGHYISMLKTYGEINGVFRAFYTNSINDTWFTDTRVFSDTKACVGGVFDAGTPVFVYGSHQTLVELSQNNGLGYFSSRGDIHLFGMIWDIGNTKDTYQSVQYPIKVTTTGYSGTEVIPNIGMTASVKYDNLVYKKMFETKDLLSSCFNLLDSLIIPTNYIKTSLIHSAVYTLDGVDLLSGTGGNTFTLLNFHNLFNTGKMPASPYNNSMSLSSASRAVFSSASTHSLHLELVFKGSYNYEDLYLFFKVFHSSVTGTLKAEVLDDFTNQNVTETLFDNNINPNRSYYPNIVGVTPILVNYYGSRNIKLTLDLNYPSITQVNLPMLGIPLRSVLTRQLANTTDKRPVFGLESSINYGLMFYDTTILRPIYWNQTLGWRDALGFIAEKRRGTTSQRPTLTNANDVGYEYFDTNLGKYIYWDGTQWIDGTGVPASNSLKILSISQTDYDNLATKDSSTLYIIV